MTAAPRMAPPGLSGSAISNIRPMFRCSVAPMCCGAISNRRRDERCCMSPAYRAVVQPDGGYLAAEAAIEAQQKLAQQAGAELQFGETVLGLDAATGTVRITIEREVIEAGTAIV